MQFLMKLIETLEAQGRVFFELFANKVYDVKLPDLDYSSTTSDLRLEKQCILLQDMMRIIERELGLTFDQVTHSSIEAFAGVTYRNSVQFIKYRKIESLTAIAL